jgi:hypothetical protein
MHGVEHSGELDLLAPDIQQDVAELVDFPRWYKQ